MSDFYREPRKVGYCLGCGFPIFEGEDVLIMDGDMLHREEECLEYFIIEEHDAEIGEAEMEEEI